MLLCVALLMHIAAFWGCRSFSLRGPGAIKAQNCKQYEPTKQNHPQNDQEQTHFPVFPSASSFFLFTPFLPFLEGRGGACNLSRSVSRATLFSSFISRAPNSQTRSLTEQSGRRGGGHTAEGRLLRFLFACLRQMKLAEPLVYIRGQLVTDNALICREIDPGQGILDEMS